MELEPYSWCVICSEPLSDKDETKFVRWSRIERLFGFSADQRPHDLAYLQRRIQALVELGWRWRVHVACRYTLGNDFRPVGIDKLPFLEMSAHQLAEQGRTKGVEDEK